MKKDTREMVLNKYDGRCAYCGCYLEKGWHIDHIEPLVRKDVRVYDFDKRKYKTVKRGAENPHNNFLENYNPSCPSCNINKHNLTIEQFRESIENFVNSLNRYSVQYKFAKKFGLIQETDKKVVFYFEKFNK